MLRPSLICWKPGSIENTERSSASLTLSPRLPMKRVLQGGLSLVFETAAQRAAVVRDSHEGVLDRELDEGRVRTDIASHQGCEVHVHLSYAAALWPPDTKQNHCLLKVYFAKDGFEQGHSQTHSKSSRATAWLLLTLCVLSGPCRRRRCCGSWRVEPARPGRVCREPAA